MLRQLIKGVFPPQWFNGQIDTNKRIDEVFCDQFKGSAVNR